MIGLILFPFLFLFCFIYSQRSDLNTAKVVILITWIGGSLAAYGLIPTNSNDLILVVITSLSIASKAFEGRAIKMPFISFFLGMFIISIISTYLNETGLVRFLLYHRYFLQYYLILVFFVNSDLDDSNLVELNRLFVYVLLLQIIVATMKWGLIDLGSDQFGDESFGGTYALNDGSASLLITLIAFSFLLPAYLLTSSKKYLFFILLFIWFVMIGSKRAIIVMLPLMTLFIYMLLSKQKLNIKPILATIIILFGSIGLITSLNETLNPQGVKGGSALDINFIKQYIIDYSFGTGYFMPGDEFGGVRVQGYYSEGRLSTPIVLFRHLSDQGKLFTGSGTGVAVNSGRIDSSAEAYFQSIGIKTGISGFTWVSAQIGYIGGLIFTFFLLRVFWITWSKYSSSEHNNSDSVYLIGLLGFLLVFLFDYMLYSQSMIRGEWYYSLLFYLIYRTYYHKGKESDKYLS